VRSFVAVELHDGWASLVIDRSEKRNALSHALVDELIGAIDEVLAGGRTVLVLSAVGAVFCAGGDRGEVHTRPVASDRLLSYLATVPAFVIARVSAPVIGAGVSVVASCPVVVATPSATFALPEASMGNLPIPIVHLEPTIRTRRLLDVGVRGSVVGAAEAHARGLVTTLCYSEDAVDGEVRDWIGHLLARPAVADQARRYWQSRLSEVAVRDAEVRALVVGTAATDGEVTP
jgi:enoyl-CoA hydratase/carnithine racemase